MLEDVVILNRPQQAERCAAVSLAIVGGGPFCTYALERLAAIFTTRAPSSPLNITVYEKSGRFGVGVHSDLQAWTSYLNRTASQVSFAADQSNSAAGPLLPSELRPTLFQWAQQRLAETGDDRYRIAPQDVPRRRLHGEALKDAFQRYRTLLGRIPRIVLQLRATEVVDIRRDGVSSGFLVVTADRPDVAERADHVLLVTGHPANDIAEGSDAARYLAHSLRHRPGSYVHNPYPFATQLSEDAAPPGSIMAMRGLGLTAIDILLHLTEGRGGRFVPVDEEHGFGRLAYVRSGLEPKTIVAFGPSGLFSFCRPQNQKAVDGSGLGHALREHKGAFLTLEAVRALRLACGKPTSINGEEIRQLDYGRHILPLLVLEMAHVYYGSLLGAAFAERIRHAVERLYDDFLQRGATGVEALLAPVQALFDAVCESQERWHGTDAASAEISPLHSDAIDWFEARLVDPRASDPCPSIWGRSARLADRRFDWRQMFDPLDAADALQDWSRALIAFMRRDLAAAAQGNLNNPIKAASDGVWRDLRAVHAATIDFGGLTADSHRQFIGQHLRIYNRMSNGGGLEPMCKLLALIECGLIDMSCGPGAFVEPLANREGFAVVGPRTRTRREVDILIEGRAHGFDIETDRSPLYRNMRANGLIRKWANPGAQSEAFMPGGVSISREFHPIQADGQPERRLTVLGAPVERVAFFQLTAARPHCDSAVLNGIANWANRFADAVWQTGR